MSILHWSACFCIAIATACGGGGDGDDTTTPPPVSEDCALPGDEDGNGLTDCADPACAGAPSCQTARCGNGQAETGEVCDDGNTVNWDGCTSSCGASTATYLKASNTNIGDGFGARIAISGDGSTLAVGAEGESSGATGIGGNQADNSFSAAGAVYVFTRSGATWIQQAYVKASNTGTGDILGRAIALSYDGSTLAVGAGFEDSAATGIGGNQADNSAMSSGAVYVFARNGTTWSQQAYVKASNTGDIDTFGTRLALSGDGSTLAVGAQFESSAATGIDGNQTDNSASNSGAVYVFARSGMTWSQQAYVKASNTDADDRFGFSLALSREGSTLAVGAYKEASAATGIGGTQDDNSAKGAGAVYVFVRNGIVWKQQEYIKASNTGVDDEFGNEVALSDDGSTLAVCAHREDSAATGVGGDQASNAAQGAGAVYVFTRTGVMWNQRAYVKASNTGGGDELGWSVAISGDGSLLAVGAVSESSGATGINGNQADNSAPFSGAVYLYQ